jgi:transposase
MYVALDAHRDFCQAAFGDSSGRLTREERFETDEAGLSRLVKATRKAKVVLEASGFSMCIYDALCDTCEVKVAHPSRVKAIASARIKTDKIDARTLLQLLRADLIPEAYVPSREQRQVRELVRHRVALKRTSTRIKNQITSIFTRENIKVPGSDKFGKKGLAFMRTAKLQETHRISVDSLLLVLDAINKQVAEANKRIEVRASQNEYARLLITHPGVGLLTALAVASEVDDINRFPSYKHFCSYIGIIPSVYQSGSTDRKGHITKQGNTMLRWMLVQCARIAVRCSKRFKKKYTKLLKNGVKENKAIVAIARIIAVDMYFMLVKNEPYREQGRKARVRTWSSRPSYRLGSSPLHD